MNSSKTLLLLLLPVLLAGCRFHRVRVYVPDVDYYYVNPNKDLYNIGRVAVVELCNDSSYPQISADVTELLYQALQKKQLFGLSVVRSSTAAWRVLQPDMKPDSPATSYSLEQLFSMRQTLRCDAVLVGSVTSYRPYPHTALGLRLKLVDLSDGQLLWALEQIWDTADKTTEYRIKNYFRRQLRSGFAPLREQLAVVSPLEFIKFVAYEVAETFQPEK